MLGFPAFCIVAMLLRHMGSECWKPLCYGFGGVRLALTLMDPGEAQDLDPGPI